MEEKTAINFLLYSYFEVTLDNNEEELISAAIERAYRDASSRVLSITEETRFCSGEGQEDKLCKEAAAEFLKKKINEPPAPEGYDIWFNCTCRHLEEIYKYAKNAKDEYAFRFGHAQKWVNMTMKYLCVIKGIFKKYGQEKVFEWLNSDMEKVLHIPVDSYIMEAAASDGKISVKRKKQDFFYGLAVQLPNKNGEGSYSKAKSWSNWDDKDYSKFREKFIEKFNEKFAGTNPLDWEGPAWIAIAKIRKERERK